MCFSWDIRDPALERVSTGGRSAQSYVRRRAESNQAIQDDGGRGIAGEVCTAGQGLDAVRLREGTKPTQKPSRECVVTVSDTVEVVKRKARGRSRGIGAFK